MKKNIFAKTRLDDDDDDEQIEDDRERLTELSDIVEQKLLDNRQIFLWGPVEDESARDIVSKLHRLYGVGCFNGFFDSFCW